MGLSISGVEPSSLASELPAPSTFSGVRNTSIEAGMFIGGVVCATELGAVGIWTSFVATEDVEDDDEDRIAAGVAIGVEILPQAPK